MYRMQLLARKSESQGKKGRIMAKTVKITSWILRIAVAVILVQTLFFKFTGAPESIYIFETMGMEPYGRFGTGIVELIASIFVLWPGFAWLGSILALGVISGAIMSHLTKLGIVVMDDGGALFGMAVFVWVASAILLWLHRKELPFKRHAP